VVLADEINRTPPKTQAALIEAMEERQVSVAGRRLPLARPFFVLATQNPIELEGTYPLPVSQLDRFLFSIPVDYPSPAEEFRMVVLTTSTYSATIQPVIDEAGVLGLIRLASAVEVSEEIYEYASRLVRSTRPASGEATTFSKEFVAWGGGPRATKALVGAARALALMEARTRVEVDDLRQVLVPALRHRIVPRYHAQAEGIRCEDIIGKIVEEVPAPGSGRTPASALPA